MKNKEYYKEQMLELFCEWYSIAIDKETHRPCACEHTNCERCEFYPELKCTDAFKQWLNQKVCDSVLTDSEKQFTKDDEQLLLRLDRDAIAAVKAFGTDAQLDHACEEFAEFIAARNHRKRNRSDGKRELIEETADSIILARQLEYIFRDEIYDMIRKKLNKLEEQIDDHRKCGDECHIKKQKNTERQKKMTDVNITYDNFEKFRNLMIGDAFIYNALMYVKTPNAGGKDRFNAVTVGHTQVAWFEEDTHVKPVKQVEARH